MVFVKYNQALKERFDTQDVIDPILLNNIDDSNECLVGELGGDGGAEDELVFDDDTLTWGAVYDIIGISEPTKHTRQQARLKKKVTSRPSSSRGKEPIHDEEEDEANDVETEEEEEIYKSSSGESDNEEEENLEDLEYDDSD